MPSREGEWSDRTGHGGTCAAYLAWMANVLGRTPELARTTLVPLLAWASVEPTFERELAARSTGAECRGGKARDQGLLSSLR